MLSNIEDSEIISDIQIEQNKIKGKFTHIPYLNLKIKED
jgi:hypothetical protein